MTTANSPADRNTIQLMRDTLERQRAAFYDEGEVRLETRVDRIDRCLALLVDNQQKIIDAVDADFGSRSRYVTLITDIFTSVSGAKFVKKRLKKWMKPERRSPGFPLNLFGAHASVQYQPKGVVGLMTPWNVPINMIFTPLVDIFGAGNRCMIKPSEYTPATAGLVRELFARYFDETEVAVFSGGPDIGAAFSALPFDHLIFTGATGIGRHVMRACADNLTPVTLELGGKSPVIIGEDVDLDDCTGKLAAGKMLNAGQLCIAPDYCFVPETRLEATLSLIKQHLSLLYPTIRDNPDYVSMINERHYQRILSYIADARKKGARVIEVNPAGEDFSRQSSHKVPPHLIVDPDDDTLAMQNEIFGPVLMIKRYRHIDDVISYINARPRPLALYYFGRDQGEMDKVLAHTTAGGVTINDVGMHVGCEDIPFGGIGNSGMGNYHGIEGFRTFSHAKAVFRQGRVNIAKLGGTLPPYGYKLDKMMAQQIKK